MVVEIFNFCEIEFERVIPDDDGLAVGDSVCGGTSFGAAMVLREGVSGLVVVLLYLFISMYTDYRSDADDGITRTVLTNEKCRK